MARQLDIEISNLVCRFGPKLVLNDLLEEVVIPAFFRVNARDFGETQFFFTEQTFGYLKEGDIDSLALHCRFIKSTVLRRHQVYSPSKGLVTDEKSIESAPSAVAILLLKSHRLLYVREVPHAPAPAQFGTTLKHFLRLSMSAFQNERYQAERQAGSKVTKKAIKARYPSPEVDVIPVVSSESLKHFVNRFKSLNTLKFEIAPTNSELDNSEFFKMLRESKSNVASKTTVIQHHNPNGLNKAQCVSTVEAAKQGNAHIYMKGTDSNGDELKGNNENFSVRATLEEPGEEYDALAIDAYEKYEELVEDKVVVIGYPTRDDSKKLQDVFKRYQERSQS